MRWKLEHILKRKGAGILFEDDVIIAINKPAGLLVLPDRFDIERLNLYSLLKEIFGSIFVVHRIDKDTSGVIVFAKTADAHTLLSMAFESRDVKKYYRAIVQGFPEKDNDIIDLPITETSDGKMSIARTKGKESLTEYAVIERFQEYALLDIQPQSGRTHQIRVHLCAIQLPILGDPLYGDGRGFYLSSIKKDYRLKENEEQPLIKRTALHAYSLSFAHPITRQTIKLHAPLPKDMEAVLKSLRKYGSKIQTQIK